ncbi:MAG: molybdopterin synthase catalytic subunit MoaE [Sulfuriferula sp.]|nr:molybdopterin synthase catalytic subunit MoaE [Sulfuriferula sp.]
MKILVTTADFDLTTEVNLLRENQPQIGAVVSFVGLVRDINHDCSVASMELEHYPAMTEKSLHGIVTEAQQRWHIIDVTIIHRVGKLSPCDQIVLVAVATMHRHDAFAACEFIMDYLKTRAPFWKKEHTPDGAHWVDARESDELAQQRWATPQT